MSVDVTRIPDYQRVVLDEVIRAADWQPLQYRRTVDGALVVADTRPSGAVVSSEVTVVVTVDSTGVQILATCHSGTFRARVFIDEQVVWKVDGTSVVVTSTGRDDLIEVMVRADTVHVHGYVIVQLIRLATEMVRTYQMVLEPVTKGA